MNVPYGLDPYENDIGRWGASLLNNAELLVACLDAARPSTVMEVGAYAGDLTRLLLRWAADHGARVTAVDPSPQPELEQLASEHSELTLDRRVSLEALRDGAPAEAYFIDGDHNYHTVSQELHLIAGQHTDRPLPLFVLHDVCWPHGRRDDYYDPSQIPAEARHPTAPGGGLFPGVEGVRPGGLPYRSPAAREGGPRNGVLTAAEDFVAAQEGVRLAVVPAFFGMGVIYPVQAPYAEELTRVLEPWEGNPLLARLEANRVLHLASSHVWMSEKRDADQRLERLLQLMEAMLASRAFAAAELFLRLRQRGHPAFSRRAVREAIGRE